MNNTCHFYKSEYYCTALAVKKCDGCTFRKTEEEFNADVEHAKEILKAKGLIAVEKDIDGVNCMIAERV